MQRRSPELELHRKNDDSLLSQKVKFQSISHPLSPAASDSSMSSSVRANSAETSVTLGISYLNSQQKGSAVTGSPHIAMKPIAQDPNTQDSANTPTGLISKKYELPPLPKSGRKRLSDDAPTSKRVAQNRVAQRIHRDKRAERQAQMEARNKILEKEVSTLGADKAAIAHQFERAAQEWRAKDSESQKQIQALSAHINKLQEDIMCGGCDENTPCACIESASANLKLHLPLPPLPPTAKALTPADFRGILQPEHSSLEMDHTTAFSKGSNVSTSNASEPPSMESVSILLPKPKAIEPRSIGGMCDMCRTDPKRFILCKALGSQAAQSIAKHTSPANDSEAMEISQQDPSNPLLVHQERSTLSKVTLPCKEVTTALMNHRGFEQASAELESWLGDLKGVASKNGNGAWGLEVEAASVLTTLSHLDRRFGSDGTQ